MSHQGNGSKMFQACFRKFHGLSGLPYAHIHQCLSMEVDVYLSLPGLVAHKMVDGRGQIRICPSTASCLWQA